VNTEQDKIRRQAKNRPKARFQLVLAKVNREELERLASGRRTSMSRVVNDWLDEMRGQWVT
jgi:hypothetical protein